MRKNENLYGREIIMVTASYDTLSIAPMMSQGVNAASGMMAVNDLGRMFESLFNSHLKNST